MALALGPNVSTINPYGSLDIKLNGAPIAGNNYGSIPDITVISIIGNGNVGIGTTNPTSILHLQGTGGVSNMISFNNSGNPVPYVGCGYDQTNGTFSVMVNIGTTYLNTTALVVKQVNGNVGIGTTNPSATLHVNGGIRGVNGVYSYTTTFSYYSGNADWNTQSIFGDPSAWPWGGNTFLVTLRGPPSFAGNAVRASFIVFHSRWAAGNDNYGQVTALSNAWVSGWGITDYALRFTFNSSLAQTVTINILVLN